MFHATYTAHFIRTIEPLLQRFLPPSLVVILKEDGPDVMLKVFDRDHEMPELIWNGAMRGELRAALAEQLDSFVKRRTKPDAETRDFILSPNARAKYKNLEGELYIGGVYVRLFLKEPTFNLRDPTSFLEKLLIRWTHELEVYISSNKKKGGMDEPNASIGAVSAAQQDALQLVTSASIYLCKVRDSLCDKLAQWGYMTRALAMMHEVLACKLIGAPLLSIMRILHVASNRLVNVESLAVAGDSDGKSDVVYYTIQAIGRDPLHKDCAFMVEVLLKVFRKALGDVKNASKVAKMPSSTSSGREDLHMYSSSNTVPAAQQQFRYSPTAHTMAPSPAPGLEPVRKSAGKAKIEHPLDHPLAFGGPDMTTSNQAAAPPPGTRFGNGRHIASQHDHPLASPLAAGNQPAVHPLSHPSNRTNFSPQPSQSHPNQAQGTQAAGYYSSSQPANFQSTVAPSLVPLSHAPYSYIQTSNLPFGGNAPPYVMQTQPAPHLVGEQYTQSRMQQATMQHSSQMLSRSHPQVNTPYPSAPMQPSFGTLGTTHQASSQGPPSNNNQDVLFKHRARKQPCHPRLASLPSPHPFVTESNTFRAVGCSNQRCSMQIRCFRRSNRKHRCLISQHQCNHLSSHRGPLSLLSLRHPRQVRHQKSCSMSLVKCQACSKHSCHLQLVSPSSHHPLVVERNIPIAVGCSNHRHNKQIRCYRPARSKHRHLISLLQGSLLLEHRGQSNRLSLWCLHKVTRSMSPANQLLHPWHRLPNTSPRPLQAMALMRGHQ